MFRHLPEFQVVLCTKCQACIPPGKSSLERHVRLHGIKGDDFKATMAMLLSYDLVSVEEVRLPRPLEPAIEGLVEHRDSFECLHCGLLTISDDAIKRHVSSEHGYKGKARNSREAWRNCNLQTFFKKTEHVRYFKVEVNCSENHVPLAIREATSTVARDELNKDFDEAQLLASQRYDTVRAPEHVSEMTPWLKRTGFWRHLVGLDKMDIGDTYKLPAIGSDPEMTAILNSVERILKRAYHLEFSTLAAQELNFVWCLRKLA